MNEIVQSSSVAALATAIPEPRVGVAMRVATMEDVPAIDALQKQYHRQLGFFPRAQMDGYIKNGWMVVAEEAGSGQSAVGSGQNSSLPTAHCLPPTRTLVGYCASRDRYLKRDELGVVYQLCVAPGCQRKFVGMALLRHVFDRSAYGCKLYCCWCAQDLAANHFWEAMGFVPLAYRTGSMSKGRREGVGVRREEGDDSLTPHASRLSPRVHIFWQKRIREGDTVTPWWYPCKTEGGAIRDGRIVLPIPPGVHWSEVRAWQGGAATEIKALPTEEKDLPTGASAEPVVEKKPRRSRAAPIPTRPGYAIPEDDILVSRNGLWFAKPPAEGAAEAKGAESQTKSKSEAKRPRAKKTPKCAPASTETVAAARELRDRYLDRVNQGARVGRGKYDLVRAELRVDSRELREKNALPLSTLNPQLSTSTSLLDAA